MSSLSSSVVLAVTAAEDLRLFEEVTASTTDVGRANNAVSDGPDAAAAAAPDEEPVWSGAYTVDAAGPAVFSCLSVLSILQPEAQPEAQPGGEA